jgi:hypothetical protein
MIPINAIRNMLERLGFSEAAATYLTGTCGIDGLDEITYLDGIEDVDTTIKGVTNIGGTVMTGSGATRVTSCNNGILVSIRAVANLQLCVYYLKHMERVQRQPIANAINLVLVHSYSYQQHHEGGSRKLLKNLRSMTKIGQGTWRRSNSTLPLNMVSLEQHWIMLSALILPSNLKLKILLKIMRLWIKK